MQKRIKFLFSFFDGKLSPNFGKPCCRYNQNNIPLNQQQIEEVIQQRNLDLKFWQLSEDLKSLKIFLFFEDYYKIFELLEKVKNIDYYSGIQNKPNIMITQGELLTIELTAHSLKGLSYFDFDLALRLNNDINYDDYGVLVNSNQRYRREARNKLKQKESEEFQKMLKETKNENQKNQLINQKNLFIVYIYNQWKIFLNMIQKFNKIRKKFIQQHLLLEIIVMKK